MGEVSIHVVDSVEDFEKLREQWDSLQEQADITSIFETFDWQFLWWKSYGNGSALKLILAKDAGTIVGILPLHIQKRRVSAFPVALLRFVGYGADTSPDDLGPILLKGRAVELAEALARAVCEIPGWDVLDLTDMNPLCPFRSAMQRAFDERSLKWRAGRSERIVLSNLSGSWDEWLNTLHRDRRYAIRKARKNLHASYSARFFVWQDYANLNTAIDRLIQLHRMRWDASSEKSNSFATPEYVDFHRAVMHACFQRNRLRLYCLELNGEVVAMYYFYKFRDTVFLMQSGFDPKYRDVRPGQVLLGYVFEDAMAEKHRVLDFLKGNHRYKDELANGERETVFLEAFRKKPGALVYRVRRHYLPAMKARLMELIERRRQQSRQQRSGAAK